MADRELPQLGVQGAWLTKDDLDKFVFSVKFAICRHGELHTYSRRIQDDVMGVVQLTS